MKLSKLLLWGVCLFWSCSDLGDSEVTGCMEESACNYNLDATMDDGSCLQFDCANVCGGSAVTDSCGTCEGNITDINECTCPNGEERDCLGICNGNAAEDNCGTCDINPSNDCVQDDCNEWGGDNSSCINYSTEIQPIFNADCTNCHGTQGGLDLSESESYNNLVNVISQGYAPSLLVEPGIATNSVLWKKISGTENGTQMPSNGCCLESITIQSVETWINEGAQNN
ncbi:MAG TPA: hypothetical protein QGH56_08140 [Candidatus Marinimicrobia bacterium]|jgi:hypothetical protein|nr:hypothetical protein [Candidatus Neomarinimicrobiota bacterium]|tara:strand:+ start:1492 stop:2172 length:681 start_codon:yes stop_codon:yes gene_type:complete